MYMHLARKTRRPLQVKAAGRVKFDSSIEGLRFAHNIHADHSSTLARLGKDNPEFLADVANAATTRVISQVKELDYAKGGVPSTRDLIRGALHCCQSVVGTMGFERSNTHRLQAQSFEWNKGNALLVAGCQTRSILENRLDKAIEVLRAAPSLGKWNVFVPSGDRPRRTNSNYPLTFPAEKEYMLDYVEQRLTDSEWSQLREVLVKDIRPQHERTKTRDNIEELLDHIDTLKTFKSYNIFIVSSSFHLVRIARELRAVLESDTKRPPIDSVVLVGAEDIPDKRSTKLDPVFSEQSYLRQLLFEAHLALLTT